MNPFFCTYIGDNEILMQALKAMQADSAFSLTSENCALLIAAKLSVRIPHHVSQVEAFEQNVCKLFKNWLHHWQN